MALLCLHLFVVLPSLSSSILRLKCELYPLDKQNAHSASLKVSLATINQVQIGSPEEKLPYTCSLGSNICVGKSS